MNELLEYAHSTLHAAHTCMPPPPMHARTHTCMPTFPSPPPYLLPTHRYMNYMEGVAEALPRVLYVHGSGQEVISLDSIAD